MTDDDEGRATAGGEQQRLGDHLGHSEVSRTPNQAPTSPRGRVERGRAAPTGVRRRSPAGARGEPVAFPALAPHPLTGALFASPVPPGAGWPDDPADATTAVAEEPDDVVRLAATACTTAELDAVISVCRACPRLVEWREDVAVRGRRAAFATQPYWGRPGPGFGDPDPRVLVVGLAPAANGTNRTGRMFTGDRSGLWLYRALYRAGFADRPESRAAGDGLSLRGLRIVATVRCAPPGNAPSATERRTCSPWLRRDFELAQPRLEAILALGSIAWDATLSAARSLGWTAPRPKPHFGHGAEVILTTVDPARKVRLVASYHVSQQNTFTGKLTEAMLDAVIGGLARPAG